MPEVSVIVPVYKVENKIKRCIDSLLEQTFTDFELILVDDGSPDKSGEICDTYAKLDSRIKVIHQENGGVSKARNRGIEAAKGKYISFVDSDDYVHIDFLKELYYTIIQNNTDISMCSYYSVLENKMVESSHGIPDKAYLNKKGIQSTIFMNILKGNTTGYYSLWNKMFRKETITVYKLRLDEEMSFGEDMLFVLECLKVCESIAFCAKPLYYYVLSENGLFSAYRKTFLQDALKGYVSTLDLIKDVISTDFKKNSLHLKYYYYVNHYLRGVVEHEKNARTIIRQVFENDIVRNLYRSLQQFDDNSGLDRQDQRVIKLVNLGVEKIATEYIIYLYDEQHLLRRIRRLL